MLRWFPPVVTEGCRGEAGCLGGCAAAAFLAVFLPLVVGFAWEAGGFWSGVGYSFLVALISTAGGIGVFAVFGAVHFERRVRSCRQLRRRLQQRESMSDADFCAALADCDPQLAVECRHLLAEYFGLLPTSLRPEDELRCPSGEPAGGLVYCVERAVHRPYGDVLRALGNDFWTVEPDRPFSAACADELRLFCEIVTKYRRARGDERADGAAASQ